MYQFVLLSFLLIASNVCFCSFKNEHYSKLFNLWFVFFGILAGLRSINIGNDTYSYCTLFEGIAYSNYFSIEDFGRFEPGFLLYNKLLSLFSHNYQILIIVTSIIVFKVFYHFIKSESKYSWICITLFFLGGYFRFTLSAMRQTLALCILIIGFYALKKNKKLFFLGSTIIASLFHHTALIFGIIIFFSLMKWRASYYKMLPFFSFLSVFFFDTLSKVILVNFYDYGRYLNSIYAEGETRIASFVLLGLACLSLSILCYTKYNKQDVFFKLTYIKVCILIIALNLNAIDRLAEYITLFEIVALSNCVQNLEINKRVLIVSLLYLVYFSYTFTWGVLRPDIQMVWPYEFFF